MHLTKTRIRARAASRRIQSTVTLPLILVTSSCAMTRSVCAIRYSALHERRGGNHDNLLHDVDWNPYQVVLMRSTLVVPSDLPFPVIFAEDPVTNVDIATIIELTHDGSRCRKTAFPEKRETH
jgi:hypothetical protein